MIKNRIEIKNLNNNKELLYKNNIPQNINKLSRMIDVVHTYYGILHEDIKDVFEELFKDFFRINIKNKLSLNPIIERKLSIKDKNTTNIKIYILVPEIYYKEINGNLIIEDTTEIFKGSFGTVYKSIL